MKKLILLALISTIAFTGCKKKSDDNKPSYTAEVTVGTTKTTFSDLSGIKITLGSTSGCYITDREPETSKNSFSVSLNKTATGTIDFGSDNDISITIGSKSYTSKNSAGKIIISQSDDSTISGTFTGTFTDDSSKEVTISGTFAAGITTGNLTE